MRVGIYVGAYARRLVARAGFVNGDGAAIKLRVVELVDCSLTFSVVFEFDKTKATASA